MHEIGMNMLQNLSRIQTKEESRNKVIHFSKSNTEQIERNAFLELQKKELILE
jgi:hypothetical protein